MSPNCQRTFLRRQSEGHAVGRRDNHAPSLTLCSPTSCRKQATRKARRRCTGCAAAAPDVAQHWVALLPPADNDGIGRELLLRHWLLRHRLLRRLLLWGPRPTGPLLQVGRCIPLLLLLLGILLLLPGRRQGLLETWPGRWSLLLPRLLLRLLPLRLALSLCLRLRRREARPALPLQRWLIGSCLLLLLSLRRLCCIRLLPLLRLLDGGSWLRRPAARCCPRAAAANESKGVDVAAAWRPRRCHLGRRACSCTAGPE